MTTAGVTTGKSTHDSSLSAGEATRALTVPQAPYAYAVHQALAGAGMAPDATEAGLRRVHSEQDRWELHIRLVWASGHPVLADEVEAYGLTLAWMPMTGWSVHDLTDAVPLPVDELADPPLLVAAVRHYARHGLGGGAWEPGADGRWTGATRLDMALSEWDAQEERRRGVSR